MSDPDDKKEPGTEVIHHPITERRGLLTITVNQGVGVSHSYEFYASDSLSSEHIRQIIEDGLIKAERSMFHGSCPMCSRELP